MYEPNNKKYNFTYKYGIMSGYVPDMTGKWG